MQGGAKGFRFGKDKKREAAKKVFLVVSAAVDKIAEASGRHDSSAYNLDRFIRGYMGQTVEEVPGLVEVLKTNNKVRAKRYDVEDWARDAFPTIRGWVNNIRGHLHRGVAKYPTNASALYFPDMKTAKATRDALMTATMQICQMDSEYEICRQEKHTPTTSPVLARRAAQKEIDLNELWRKKCGDSEVTDPEWLDSLFCAMGKGNLLANFITRMRFKVPEDPNRNFFKKLYSIISDNNTAVDRATKTVLDAFLQKIDRRENFRWSDLSTLVQLMRTIPALRRTVESNMNFYGLSTEPVPDRKRRKSSELTQPSVNLQRMWDEMCKRGGPHSPPPKWEGTLFCEIGRNDAAAKLIGKLRFVVPPGDPNNHVIIRVIKMMTDGFKAPDPLTGKQSWKNWALERAMPYITNALSSKILSKKTLTWDDLNNLYLLTQVPLENIPIVGSRIASYLGGKPVSQIIEESANATLNRRGLDFAPA